MFFVSQRKQMRKGFGLVKLPKRIKVLPDNCKIFTKFLISAKHLHLCIYCESFLFSTTEFCLWKWIYLWKCGMCVCVVSGCGGCRGWLHLSFFRTPMAGYHDFSLCVCLSVTLILQNSLDIYERTKIAEWWLNFFKKTVFLLNLVK